MLLYSIVPIFALGFSSLGLAAVVTTAVTITTPTQSPWTSIQTNPALYNMAITTTFTPPAACTGQAVTQMAWRGRNLWELVTSFIYQECGTLEMHLLPHKVLGPFLESSFRESLQNHILMQNRNAINPLATSTITTCYPSQFYSSVMGAINSVVLPAFSALVCPYEWKFVPYNSTYGVCCPAGFGVNAPNYAINTDRPFSGAACTSTIGPGQLYDIFSYDTSTYWTEIPTSAPADGTFVRVNAFDGFLETGVPAATTVSSSTSSCTPAATVSVTFQIPFAVTDSIDGENINLVGSTPNLGSWAPENSTSMSDELYSLSNPLWETTVAFAAGTFVQYQYLHYLANGSYISSTNPKYNLTIPTGCSTTEIILDAWR